MLISMADSLPSPPASRGTTPEQSTHEDLRQTLDHLLAQYLELLDKYSTLRKDLSKTFSTGFFSLANAQRTANMGSGRRYGQDGYDSRMKALRRVKIQIPLAVEEKANGGSEVGEELSALPLYKFELHEDQSLTDRFLPESTAGASDQEHKAAFTENSPPDITESEKRKPNPSYRDPASWYGIFISQPLRQTQSSFTSSLEGSIPSLVTINSAMIQLEERIWDVRSELGITGEYDYRPKST